MAWLENALLAGKTASAAPSVPAPAPAPARSPSGYDWPHTDSAFGFRTGGEASAGSATRRIYESLSNPRFESSVPPRGRLAIRFRERLRARVDPPAAPQPGEFTRAFNPQFQPYPAAVDSTGPVPLPGLDTGPVSKPPAVQQPGEFTRAFQLPNPAAPPPRTQYPAAATGPNTASAKPGEFTRLFQVPGPGENRPSPPAPELGLPPSMPETNSPSTRSAGEFTRLFRPPAAAPSSPWAQPNDTPLRDLPPRQTFPPPELPAEPAPPKFSLPSGPVPLPERSAPPVPKGPGEYTRIIQTQPLQTAPPQASAPPPPSPSLSRRRSSFRRR